MGYGAIIPLCKIIVLVILKIVLKFKPVVLQHGSGRKHKVYQVVGFKRLVPVINGMITNLQEQYSIRIFFLFSFCKQCIVNTAVRISQPLTFIKIIRSLLPVCLDFHRPKMTSMCCLSAANLLGVYIDESAAIL